MLHLQIGMSRLLQAGVNAVSTQWSSSSPPSSSSLLSPSAPSPPVVITCVQNQSHSQSPCLLHRLLKRRLTINSIKINFYHFSTHSHFSAAPACCWCIHYLDDALQGMSRRWMKNDWQIYIFIQFIFRLAKVNNVDSTWVQIKFPREPELRLKGAVPIGFLADF